MAFLRQSNPVKKEKRKMSEEQEKSVYGPDPAQTSTEQELIDLAENDLRVDEEVKSKICIRCDKPKDLATGFGRHAKTKDGYANTCRECRSKTMTERNKYSRAALAKDKIKAKELGVDQDDLKIELDFTDHLTVYREICQAAEDRLRSPKNQIMWWIINCDFDKLQKGLAGE